MDGRWMSHLLRRHLQSEELPLGVVREDSSRNTVVDQYIEAMNAGLAAIGTKDPGQKHETIFGEKLLEVSKATGHCELFLNKVIALLPFECHVTS